MSQPTCGICGKSMTPENSKVSPELFLCDGCAWEMNAGLQPAIDRGKAELDLELKRYQMKAGVAREDELALREQIERLKAQLEAAQKREVMMREALEPLVSEYRRWLAHSGRNSKTRREWNDQMPSHWEIRVRLTMGACRLAALALSTPEPTSYVSKEAVRPIVEAADRVYRNALIANAANQLRPQWVKETLAGPMLKARELGLLESGFAVLQ